MNKTTDSSKTKPKPKICKECGATPAEPNSDYCKKHINTPSKLYSNASQKRIIVI